MTPRKLAEGFKIDQTLKRRKAAIRKMAKLQFGLELVERGLPGASLQGPPIAHRY